ncbi:MAG: hypothetical protein E7158_01005 [Firmicutes bacterium]|nr:hypothetical protein [Bacillota bacterium]
MITNRQKNFMVIFCCNSLFLGLGYFIIFNTTNNNSFICSLIGGLLGLLFTFIYKIFLEKKKDKRLTEFLNEYNTLGKIIRLLLILLSIAITLTNIFIIKEFIKSFFLINMPSFLITLPILLLIVYISFKDYNILAYISECLIPISLVLTIFIFIALIFKADYSNLKPFFSSNTISMIKSIFYYFVLSTSPLLLLSDIKFNSYNISNVYLLNSIIITITSVLITGILGNFLTKTYRFLEYMILKNIQIFNFIEKIENILSISWIINSFLLLFLSSLFLKNLLPKKYNNYSHFFIILTINIIVCTLMSNSYFELINLYIPYILGFLLISITICFIIINLKHM